MNIFFYIVLLVVGFLLLIKGADYFVDGSSAIARKLRIPSIIVGLTIVAVGTSLPELAVSSLATVQNSKDISISNVVGSNIFNLLMVLGITALFMTVSVKRSVLKREMPFLMIISVLVAFLAGDALWFGGVLGDFNIFDFEYGDIIVGTVERVDGILLLVLFVGYIWFTVRFALKERSEALEETDDKEISNGKCALYIILGAVAIMIGGEAVVESAKTLAAAAGMSETLIGLTVVALGTSLPELVTSAVAGIKGEGDIAVGNVVGSNIANIMLVLGVSAVISPVSVNLMSLIDIGVSLIVTVVVFIVAVISKDIKRGGGVLFVAIYAGYMAYIICRQIYG